MDGGKATCLFPAFVTQNDCHEACYDWVEGQLDRQMDRHTCIPFPAPRARSPSPMASPWRALSAACQGEDCIPRVCWTQLPSLQIQAVPARGESLTVWPVHSGAFLGVVLVGAYVSTPKTGLVRRAFLYLLLALWRVQKAQVTQPLSETLGIKGYVVITPHAAELKKNAMYSLCLDSAFFLGRYKVVKQMRIK